MASVTLTRRIAFVAGAAAFIGMGALTAGCSSSTKEAPATSTAPSASVSTSSPAVSETEKGTIKPLPTIEDRGGMDSHTCPPGKTKYNGVCQ